MAYKPIRPTSFHDYSTGWTTFDVPQLTWWLVDRPLLVTMAKHNGFAKFLKCSRNIIWNVQHPKNDLVADENSMFFPCISTPIDIYGAGTVHNDTCSPMCFYRKFVAMVWPSPCMRSTPTNLSPVVVLGGGPTPSSVWGNSADPNGAPY